MCKCYVNFLYPSFLSSPRIVNPNVIQNQLSPLYTVTGKKEAG